MSCLSVVALACNPSTQEADAGGYLGPQVQPGLGLHGEPGQSRVCRETQSQKNYELLVICDVFIYTYTQNCM